MLASEFLDFGSIQSLSATNNEPACQVRFIDASAVEIFVCRLYHLYRCSNSRRIHEKKTYTSEGKIWDQFAPVLEKIVINEEFANDVRKVLNEDYENQKNQAQANMDICKKTLKELDEKEDATYDDMKRGLLDELQYHRRIRRIRDERDECKELFERLRLLKSDSGVLALEKMFELAITAESEWKDMDRQERVSFLKKVCSNPTLDAVTLRYEMKKPFARLSSMKGFSEWRRRRDSNPRYRLR